MGIQNNYLMITLNSFNIWDVFPVWYQAETYKFTRSIPPSWVFFTFFKLQKY